MTDAWRFHVLASIEALARAWPDDARRDFLAEVMAAPEAWRPTGDDDAERAAGARALARAWFAAWARDHAPLTDVPVGPPPVRPIPGPELPEGFETLGGLDAASADELAILWRFLGRELAFATWRRR